MKKYLVIFYMLLLQPLAAQIVVDKELLSDSREMIILQTTRRFFITGETLQFHIQTLINEAPSRVSRIAYLELINEKKEAVLQQKVSLEDGESAGEFYLPSILPTGKYYLIAYTKWMKNYPENHFPVVSVSIVNPFRPVEKQKTNSTAAIEFFTESGHAIAGLPATLVYSIKANKNIQPKELRILDQDGISIAVIPCYGKLTGRFSWIPENQENYRVILISGNDDISYHNLKLDLASNHLNVMKDGNRFLITPYFDDRSRAQLRYGSDSIPLVSGSQISIRESELDPGINILQLVDQHGILSQRPVLVVPDYYTLNARLDKSTAMKRDKITLSIASDDCPSSVSVSIRQKDPSGLRESILDDLYFKPYGILMDSQNGSLKKNSLWEDIDNQVIIHQGSFLKMEPATPKYLPEIRGMILEGKVTRKDNGEPVRDDVINLSIQSDPPQIFTSMTDQYGNFRVLLKEIQGSLKGFCTLHEGQKVELSTGFLEKYDFIPDTPWIPGEELLEWIRKKSIEVQLENAYFEYTRDSLIEFEQPEVFYGKPDASYLLSDYTAFPTMEDVITEYVLGVGVRYRNGKPRINIHYNNNQLHQKDSSIIMINSVPIISAQSVLDLNPSEVERIDVIFNSYVLGSMNAAGIVNFILKEQFAGSVGSKKGVHIVPIKGVQPDVIKYEPEHIVNPASRMPDLRRDLYWNGSLKIDERGREIIFYTSNLTGEYEIILSGVNERGELIQQELNFQVAPSYE